MGSALHDCESFEFNSFLSVMEYIYENFDVTTASIEKLKLIKVNYENGSAVSSSILAEYNLKRMETSR